MKVLVIGLGSIGKRHAENVRTLRPDAEICVYDPRLLLGDERMLDDLSSISCAIIASPTERHYEYIDLFSHAATPIFVEKPVCSIKEIPLLEMLLGMKFLEAWRTAVGHQYRYLVQGELINAWRENGSVEFYARDNLVDRYGPTCLETMASHSIDLALHVYGPARYVKMQTDGVSVQGVIVHDPFSRSEYDLRIDAVPRQALATSGQRVDELNITNEFYLAELVAFLDYARTGQHDGIAATLMDGLAVMKVMEQVKRVSL